jgi:PadR family transcriptional regulator PadR
LRFYKSGGIVLPVEARGGLPTGFWRPAAERPTTMNRLELPQGTLDLLILQAVSLGRMHGWAISERLHQVSEATLLVPQGSLYPALHRLERRGWVVATWGASDNNRKAKYYELTRAGRRQLAAETESWQRLADTVGRILAMR